MARVSWNDAGQRFYEAGTDRGVLYLEGHNGVPWNGLIGVNESPTGGEARPYYLDGFKYLNIAVAEEFAATIKGYSSPREFDACDGTFAINNGLFVTQQPRKPFGLSYRTLVGNDTDGISLGYKIHIVYNALASPASKSYQSLSNSVSPLSLDWSITTVPPQLSGIRPTAHFVIDSRITPPRLLKTIEDILYGTASTESRLPTAEELATLFKSLPPIAATNLMTNGSFEYSTSTIAVRQNLNTNPRLINNVNGWTGGSGFSTITATASGAQVDVTTTTTSGALFYQSVSLAGSDKDRVSASMEVTVPDGYPAATLVLRVFSYGQNLTVSEGPVITIEPGTTVTVVADSNAALTSATTGYRTILYAGGTGVPQGGRLIVKNALAEKALRAGPYFDGSTHPKVRRNAATRPQPSSSNGWFTNAGTIATRSYDAVGGIRPGTGAAVLTRVTPTGDTTVISSVYAVGTNRHSSDPDGWIPVVAGEVWTASAAEKSDVPHKSQLSIHFLNSSGATMPGSNVYGEHTPDTPAGQWVRATATATVPAGARYMHVMQDVKKTDGNVVGGEKSWMTEALIERVENMGDFFDSTTTPPSGYKVALEGEVGFSASYMYDDDFTVDWGDVADASISTLRAKLVGTYSSPSAVVRGIQSKHWVKDGAYSLRQIPMHITRGSGYTEYANQANASSRGLIPGGTYTIVGSFYQKKPQEFDIPNNASMYYRAITFLGITDSSYTVYKSAENVSGQQELRLVFTVPMTGSWSLRLYNGGMFGDESVWWDDFAIVDGIYDGPAFNGDTPDTDIRIYDWIGLPHRSESTLKTWY